jgi:hypothetical protein
MRQSRALESPERLKFKTKKRQGRVPNVSEICYTQAKGRGRAMSAGIVPGKWG